MGVVFGIVMYSPVSIGLPTVAPGFVKLISEFLDRLLLSVGEGEGLSQVVDVVKSAQLGDSSGQHHDKEGDQEVALAPQDDKCLLTNMLEPARLERRD